MRLLNSSTLELEEFMDDRIPRYAILSHRWQDDEVSLQDVQTGIAVKKAGYVKLKLCCEQALKDGLKYSWIDTCCIDKTSSAELSESINSMYRWYQDAVKCYAYLFDVTSTKVSDGSGFADSAWFTRGWTLQELVAPSIVEFYNSTWTKFGTKESMKYEIEAITGIDTKMLEGANPEEFSAAKRMSWASQRTTTRIEDVAYSLLGIFGVNMPMLYGEGDKAFVRLQEEILKHSDDHSLFAWSTNDDCHRGLLAKSPAAFRSCSDIVTSRTKLSRSPYSVTNVGLSIDLPMVAWAMETYFAALNCAVETTPSRRIGIFLKLLPEDDQYARIKVDGEDIRAWDAELTAKCQIRKIYIRQKAWGLPPAMDRLYGFWLRRFPSEISPTSAYSAQATSEVTAWNEWSNDERILKIPSGSSGTAGVIWYESGNSHRLLKLGFDIDFNPVCQMGGNMYGPTPAYHFADPKSFDRKMDNGWMYQRSNFLTKGNRWEGLCVENPSSQLVISDQVIDNQRMWVVDLVEGIQIGGVICDGCSRGIYNTRFKCLTCADFDFCMICHRTAGETHFPNETKKHKFKKISA